MEEKILLIISLIVMSLGITGLFILYETQDLEEVSNIETHLENTVKISGKIKKIDVRDDLTFLEIERTNIVKVIFFEELDLNDGQDVIIIGDVDKYKGEYEILGKKIINE
ncbi:hypothetical protein KY334_07475 [Candidatus Woesearchaeota archaeon]|nr:hypothetical protein [Candidatus Woesearchaeota archaeon]